MYLHTHIYTLLIIDLIASGDFSASDFSAEF